MTHALAGQFRDHFAGADHLYAHLTRAMADDLEADGVTAAICADVLDAPTGAVIQLRVLAGIQREVLSGRADELVPFYPSLGGAADPAEAWPLVRAVMERSVDRLREGLAFAPQTNEVGRSAALLVGISHAVRARGMTRIRLLEPGASAGLNLLFDHYAYAGDGWTFGPPESPCRIESVGAKEFSAESFEIVARAGCDVHPVDAGSAQGALWLRSFTWPFQVERCRRLEGALTVAAEHPIVVERAGGAEWTARKLAEPVADDVLTVVWQSITRQYWPADELAALDACVAAARSRIPLAHIEMEPDLGEVGEGAVVNLPQISVDGVVIATCGFHGPPVDLAAG